MPGRGVPFARRVLTHRRDHDPVLQRDAAEGERFEQVHGWLRCYSNGVSTPAERAAHRRATWSGGVARSFAEAEEMDLEFWLAATPQERLRGVTQMIDEMAMMGGASGPSPRLQRAVGGTRPRRG